MDVDTLATLTALGIGAYYTLRSAWGRVAAWAPTYEDEAPPAYAAPDYAAALEDEPDADSPLTAAEWLDGLNRRPDEVPHIACCGTTGSGKTTLVMALLSQRAGRYVITTPKPASQDRWNGFPAVRLVFNPETEEPSYKAIGDAIEAAYRELNWRGLRDSDGEPLTLVIDEMTTTIAELKREGRDIVPWLIAIWLRGRSAGIRLITMDPTINVKGWGIDGRGDVRESIAFIRCLRGSRRAFLGELEDVRGDDLSGATELETHDAPRLASQSPDPARVWTPEPRKAQPTAPAQGSIVDDVREYLEERPGASQREIEEALFGYTGGDAYKQVRAALLLLRKGRATA